jgi:hypothetical protein
VNFNLKKPCANCPFLKEGAIELNEGRVEGIVAGLLSNDRECFVCHKTLDLKGDKKRSQCVGSMVYLLKVGQPSVSMRMAAACDMLDYDGLREQFCNVIEELPDAKVQSESLAKARRRRAR